MPTQWLKIKYYSGSRHVSEINSDMQTVSGDTLGTCPLPLNYNITHWHFAAQINSGMPTLKKLHIFSCYMLLNGFFTLQDTA
jgi:hypothetical protein